MPRPLRIVLLLLLLGVLAGMFEFPVLRLQILRQERQEQTEEVARREVIRGLPEGRDVKGEMVPIYWLSEDEPGQLAAVHMSLPLGTDPAERARVALDALITRAPSPEQRALPLETSVLAVYVLEDGSAIIADFSQALSHQLPSGISTEQLALDAILHTLHAAVPQARRLRILIDGQEAETLAGHVDVSGEFDLTNMSLAPPGATTESAPGKAQPRPGAVLAPEVKSDAGAARPGRRE